MSIIVITCTNVHMYYYIILFSKKNIQLCFFMEVLKINVNWYMTNNQYIYMYNVVYMYCIVHVPHTHKCVETAKRHIFTLL